MRMLQPTLARGGKNSGVPGPEHSDLEGQRTSTVGKLETAAMRGDLGSTPS